MANKRHLAMLKKGVKVWNTWRRNHPGLKPQLDQIDLGKLDLGGADLSHANLKSTDLTQVRLQEADLDLAHLEKADLSEVDLTRVKLNWASVDGANLKRAKLIDADLYGAVLNEANLESANLTGANLQKASLENANLIEAILSGASLKYAVLKGALLAGADLTGADLSEANLTRSYLGAANFTGANLYKCDFMSASMLETNFSSANLSESRIYGIASWGVKLHGANQSNLIISIGNETTITVDNLEVAQFIYLLLNNEKIRGVIDTIARKVVLILGRFTPERKVVLDAIREELRKRDYLPVLFDFDKPATRDITETMRTLAHLSRFIIADLSDPKSIPLELQAVVPDLAVPVQPLILSGQDEFSMFVDLRKKYHWVLATHQYADIADLLASLGNKVIAPAEAKAKELEKR